ncbi:MAG: hypothetical protein IT302_03315 [Dehalococcoidia bacterium]|nr:hypothetical protein [Dehalococcoidia bacterium]
MTRLVRGAGRWLGFAALAVAASLAMGACSGGGESDPATVPAAARPLDSTGIIAYVDKAGCIARVTPAGVPAGQPYCPSTSHGVSYISWLDADTIAYNTPEVQRTGWRKIDFRRNVDEPLAVLESPRVLIYGQPQVYSMDGEQLGVGDVGEVYRVEDTGNVVIYTPPKDEAGDFTRVATWAPDAKWVLLERGSGKALWAVKRDGTGLHQVAKESRGLVSWFMPTAGVLPHPDLTCALPTESTYLCRVAPRTPIDAALIDPVETGGWLNISWSPCPGVTGYELWIMPAGSETPVVTKLSGGTAYHAELSTFANNMAGTWHWKVRTYIGTAPGGWSEERTFTVGPAPRAAAIP